MPEFNWRSPESYTSLQSADVTAIAWECLRRNTDYQRDYEAIVAAGRLADVAAEFRRRWGLCFRP
jgi:hypothetical protein